MRAFDTSTYVQLTFDVVVQNSTDIVTFTNLTELDKMYAHYLMEILHSLYQRQGTLTEFMLIL